MKRSACLTSDELAAFNLGDLPEAALEELAQHLESCSACEARARALDHVTDATMAAFRRSAKSGLLAVPRLPGRIGDYEILAEIGRGGMGIVYRARHLHLGRTAALKMLLGGTMADGMERSRFRAEAGAVARLQHPNIVQIYEIGEHEVDTGLPRPYFTLEFVDGGNLSELIAGRPQPPRAAAAWVEVLARAAHYAHENGIVHRDLKPSNVLLTRDGQPKICDFGVAKKLTESDVKTLSGTLIGTVEYMAPEQAAAERTLGPACDIYSLGAILYTALTGHPPFQGPNALITLDLVRYQEPVPPRRLQPLVPRDLDTICLKCLEKEPRKRYASARALAEDLRAFLADRPIAARRPSLYERLGRWVRHNKAVAFGVASFVLALAAVAVVSAVAALQKERDRLIARRAEAVAIGAQGRAETAQQLAEEQRALAERNLYAATTNLTGVTLHAPGGMGQVQQLLNEWRGMDARDDPRGWEWFYCQSLVCRDVRTLHGHLLDASSLAWSPDGRRLVSGGFDKTMRWWDPRTGRQLRRVPAPWALLSLSWSSNGRYVASANWWDKTVTLWDPATASAIRTFPGKRQNVDAVAFSPDGRRLAASDDSPEIVVWDVATGNQLLSIGAPSFRPGAFCWSPDGRTLAFSDFDRGVKICDAERGTVLANLPVTGSVTGLRWSPDGRRLAGAADPFGIHIWDRSGTLVRTIQTPVEAFEGSMSWSPDSRRLAAACRDLAVRVWDVESGSLLRTLMGHASRIGAVCWSPDGTQLASSERGWYGTIKLWDVDAPAQPRQFAPFGKPGRVGQLRWSPDARTLARPRADGSIEVWDSVAGKRTALLPGHKGATSSMNWSRDGTRLVTCGTDGAVKIWEAAAGRLLQTFTLQEPATSVDWTADEKDLIVNLRSPVILLLNVASGSQKKLSFAGYQAARCPCDERIAFSDRYRIIIGDPRSDRRLLEWSATSDYNAQPVWSPDGRFVATASGFTVDVREAATGRAPYGQLAHTQPVLAMTWSPNSAQLATVTEGGVHLWDARSGNPILTLASAGKPLAAVAWCPDGMRVAAAAADGPITIWDAAPGYEADRAPALLPGLNARLRAQADDAVALRLRAGVEARLFQWEEAAADIRRLDGNGNALFVAGWWIAQRNETAAGSSTPAADPFAATAGAEGETAPSPPRWYAAANDANGFVPLARTKPVYLTRVYAARGMNARVALELDDSFHADIRVNGVSGRGGESAVAAMHEGWNDVAVRITEKDPSANAVLPSGAGFLLRLEPAETDADSSRAPSR